MKLVMSERLFDMDADPAPPKLSDGAARTRKQRLLLARGIHPATGLALHPDGGTCGTCEHATQASNGGWAGWKCRKHRLGMSSSAASDLRISWPACTLFEARP